MKPKRLKSPDAPRQQIWQYKGRTYSIVDLTKLPYRKEFIKAGLSLDSEKFLDLYRPFNYELADITDGVEVLDRFSSFKEAVATLPQEKGQDVTK